MSVHLALDQTVRNRPVVVLVEWRDWVRRVVLGKSLAMQSSGLERSHFRSQNRSNLRQEGKSAACRRQLLNYQPMEPTL